MYSTYFLADLFITGQSIKAFSIINSCGSEAVPIVLMSLLLINVGIVMSVIAFAVGYNDRGLICKKNKELLALLVLVVCLMLIMHALYFSDLMSHAEELSLCRSGIAYAVGTSIGYFGLIIISEKIGFISRTLMRRLRAKWLG
ncbi:MAG: hypothetical protein HQL44_13420 [Alphaproteobacteria bacterium]|nr:hypothetical protein [Alphaproteobacteria bacterium]